MENITLQGIRLLLCPNIKTAWIPQALGAAGIGGALGAMRAGSGERMKGFMTGAGVGLGGYAAYKGIKGLKGSFGKVPGQTSAQMSGQTGKNLSNIQASGLS